MMDLDAFPLDVFQLQQKALLETGEPVVILGKVYDNPTLDEVQSDTRSLMWMTYRRGFQPIGGTGSDRYRTKRNETKFSNSFRNGFGTKFLHSVPNDFGTKFLHSDSDHFGIIPKSFRNYSEVVRPNSPRGVRLAHASQRSLGTGPSSDQGWGCMLRCGQMMLAETLLRLHLGRDWLKKRDRHDPDSAAVYRRVLKMFSDEKNSLYSIHQIAQMGVSENKAVGEWFGPNTVAQVLKKLTSFDDWSQLAVHVAMDNLLALSDLNQLIKMRKTLRCVTSQPCATHPNDICTCVLSTASADGFDHLQKQSDNKTEGTGNEEDTFGPVLIIIPLRLGLTALNLCYMKAIQALYRLPQSVGIIGGRPNHALYFYGCVGTEKFLYLDPHTCQDTVNWFESEESDAPASDDLDDSYHCPFLLDLPSSSVDPSLALGLFCADQIQLDDLIHRLRTDVLPMSSPPLFDLLDKRPKGFPKFVPYSFDRSSATNTKEYAVFESRCDTDDEFEVLDD